MLHAGPVLISGSIIMEENRNPIHCSLKHHGLGELMHLSELGLVEEICPIISIMASMKLLMLM